MKPYHFIAFLALYLSVLAMLGMYGAFCSENAKVEGVAVAMYLLVVVIWAVVFREWRRWRNA